MNYEERYKQALERAKEFTENSVSTDSKCEYANEVLFKIFPELCESEDERIRKWLIEKVKGGDYPWQNWEDKVLTWLEKQGEKSEYNSYKATVKSIAEMCKSYSTSTDLHDFYDNIRVKCKDAMEYDKTWIEKQGEQKYAWSEEDEEMIDFMIEFIESLCWRKDLTKRKDEVLSWLKSLKPNWKPAENQMSMLLAVIHDGNNANSESCHIVLQSLYNDLKNL